MVHFTATRVEIRRGHALSHFDVVIREVPQESHGLFLQWNVG
jgi:hypothetical protein